MLKKNKPILLQPKKKGEIPKDKETELHSILIPDVVNESRMKFFREPRLGCYLALDLTYKTSLNYNSLLSAIKCTKEYEEAKLKGFLGTFEEYLAVRDYT